MEHSLTALARRVLTRACLWQLNELRCRKIDIYLAGLFCLLTLSASAQVSGVAFCDFDRNGVQSAQDPIEPGLPNLRVAAYVEGVPQPFTVLTGTNGQFAFTNVQVGPGKRVRLELTGQPRFTYDSPAAGTSVQFVQAPVSTVRFGLSDPSDFCQLDPTLAIPLYQSGALAPGTSGVVSFPATLLTTPPGETVLPTGVAPSAAVGTVWATAYQRQTNKLLTLSVLKRHAALGPLGLGGIYIANNTNNDPIAYLNAGTYLTLASDADKSRLATRTLPASSTATSVDGSVFGMIGKVGFGGATFTPSEDRLWAINLYERKLVAIRTGVPLRPAETIGADSYVSYDIPERDTDKGVNRPWAVAYHWGKLYVGVVNDASISGNNSDLKAYIYTFDLGTSTFDTRPILTVNLDYTKGWAVRGSDDANSLGDHWYPWSDEWCDYPTNLLNGDSNPTLWRVARPQPILSSIEFDAEGAMLLGFMDRTGHQTGRNQPAPADCIPPRGPQLYSGYTGGDLLRAALVNNAYVLEGNGSAGSHSGSGVGNKQGPSDGFDSGEFYAWDRFDVTPTANFTTVANQETFAGSLLANPSLSQLVATVNNPLATWSGGVSLFDTYNGDLLRRYEVFRDGASSSVTAPRGTFGSANGVGAISALCDAPPVEIGNRMWVDANGDGVQDPNEDPLAGVCLSLYDSKGNWLASTQTNEQGRYSFRSGLSLVLDNNTNYYVVIGTDLTRQQYDRTLRILRVGQKAYRLTAWHQGSMYNTNANDSDAYILTGTSTRLDGLPVMQFRLSLAGEVITNLDAGVQETCDPAAPACIPITFRRVK
jgi:hypothetical protein